jgi:hypothetical protein
LKMGPIGCPEMPAVIAQKSTFLICFVAEA